MENGDENEPNLTTAQILYLYFVHVVKGSKITFYSVYKMKSLTG